MERHIKSALVRMVDGVVMVKENYSNIRYGFVEDMTIVTDPTTMSYSITGTRRDFDLIVGPGTYDFRYINTKKGRDEILERFDMEHPYTEIKIQGKKPWLSDRMSWKISGAGVLKETRPFNWQGIGPVCIELDL